MSEEGYWISMPYDEYSEMFDPRSECPNIEGRFVETSKPTIKYNCLAYALGFQDRWFDPESHLPGYFWPPGIPKKGDLHTILKLLASYGYSEVSDSNDVEPGYSKIAIYIDEEEEPCHYALQLDNGEWTSKMGDKLDLRHTDLAALEGGTYGRVLMIVRKKVFADGN